MDVLQQLVDHHVDSLTELIRLAGTVPADVLDRPITSSVEQVDDDPTLRSLLGAMVTQEEHWLSALRGGGWPDESDTSLEGLARRHAQAGADYRAVVADAASRDEFADTFVDTTCADDGELTTHSLGATVAHVVTFAAVRRTQAVGVLWSAGVREMALADPRPRMDAARG